jgi:iron only hydrogenase large subunit-like protein
MKRIRATHGIDKSKSVRQSHNNPAVKKLYEELGVGPGQAHLLHTKYTDRTNEVKAAGAFGIDPSVAARKQ